jgi:predicted SAM-dependent methyltransferase
VEGVFDVIMMHHVLEHMPDQKKVLDRVHQLLSATGRVLIRIPIISEPLMNKYGVNVVSLDPPRHLFIHSVTSINKLVSDAGFKVTKMIYDALPFDIMASEQYERNISILNDDRSHFVNKQNSIFTKTELKKFKRMTKELNKTSRSSSIALYLEKEGAVN